MTMLYLFSGLLLLSFLIAWFSYRKAFFSPKMRKEDPYALPIRQMDDIPYETVSDIVIRHKPFGREVFVGMT